MANFTLKQLRYFEALCRHGNFGRAAEASSVSQPALSVQIKDLEQNLGMALFERGPREVTLTTFGADVAVRVREILRASNELEDLAQTAKSNAVGRLRVGIIPTIAPYILPRVMRALTENYAGIEVQIRETLTPNLLNELKDGRLDTAILALPVSEANLIETPLFDEDFVLIRASADAADPVPNPDTLREMKLLLLEEGHCFRDQALSFCNFPSTRPWEGLDATSLSTLVQMVAAGIGVTVLPEMAISVETRAADVSITRFDNPAPMRTIGMVWRKSTPMTDQLSNIARTIQDAVAPQSSAQD